MIPLHDKTRERGFTLLETLVTLAIVGMMASLLLSGIKTPTAFALTTKAREASLDRIVTSQARLRALIERLQSLPRVDTGGGVIDFRGSQHELALFSPPPANAKLATPKRYRLLLAANGDLVLYAAEALDDRIALDAPNLVGWEPTVLLRDVDRLALSYYGPAPGEGENRWHAEWYDRTEPPALVRVVVGFRNGDQRIWPDLIIRPAATSSSTCPIDRATGRCEKRS
ncbi:MAG: type II secretion system protein [Novosphingobium sp.]